MSIDTQIELHPKACSCGGGSWMLFGGKSNSPCTPTGASGGNVTLTTREWRHIGKPPNADAYRESESRAEAGDRREFQRFEAVLDVQLSRVSSWNTRQAQTEAARTEVIAKGGALVRSRMPVEKGESLVFIVGDDYTTKAEVLYVNTASADGESFLRVGLRFLDAPFPDTLIPANAKPI